jgi:hypothetical protein
MRKQVDEGPPSPLADTGRKSKRWLQRCTFATVLPTDSIPQNGVVTFRAEMICTKGNCKLAFRRAAGSSCRRKGLPTPAPVRASEARQFTGELTDPPLPVVHAILKVRAPNVGPAGGICIDHRIHRYQARRRRGCRSITLADA